MRAILCDDHPVYRDGLRLLLTEVGVDIVGEAGDGDEAIRLVREHSPDVVVMDLHMPGMSGVEAIRRIVAANSTVAVLVLTMLNDESLLFAALRAGARGYLLKGADHDDIERALASILRGDLVIAADVAAEFRSMLSGLGRSSAFPQLTSRENEVLALLSGGRTNREIAASFSLSEKTVRNLVSNILTKLAVRTRTEAVVKARDAGIGAALPSGHAQNDGASTRSAPGASATSTGAGPTRSPSA